MQSMTGFAEQSFSSRTLQVKLSIKSLNHRFFDWNYKGVPIGNIENRLRAICQEKLRRGRLEVSLELVFPSPTSWEVSINQGLLEKILASLAKVSWRLGREISFSADNIFRIPQVVELKRKDFSSAEVAFLEKSFNQTLKEVVKARREEGRKTGLQIKLHLKSIQRALGRIEALAKKQPSLLREKIRKRLKELDIRDASLEDKLREEVAFLTQRSDITEEVMRLKSHLSSFLSICCSNKDEPVGKKLDFLAQEIYREVNTINAKSQDYKINKESLIIKAEAESIRQHAQNLE